MSRKTASGRVLREMDPDIIYFTHARVRPVFTGCNKRIQETLDEIVSGQTKISDIPYITVIENFEAPASASADASEEEEEDGGRKRKKGGAGGGKKGPGGKGKGAKGKGAAAAEEPAPFYFSLNNRRLFLFKTLKERGLIDTVMVQVKPALERERAKYTRDRCVLRAKLMGAGAKLGGDEEGEGEGEEGSGEEGEEGGEKMDERP